MHASRLFLMLSAVLGFSAGSLAAQDIAAAVAPRFVVVGPRLLIVQKTTTGLRWRGFNAGTNAWGPWTAAPVLGSHFDGYDRVALAGWEDNGTARYNAFEAVVIPGTGAIHVAETTWHFGGPQPVSTPPTQAAPTTAVGGFFFPADAVGRITDRGFSAFGSSAASGPNGLVFAPREFARNNGFRDMVVPADVTRDVFIGPFSTTLRDTAISNWERTTAVMHEHTSGNRSIVLYSARNAIQPVVPDFKVSLGSPTGVMTQPPLLFIHELDVPGPMNLFTVARDATGRRRLFERFAQNDPTQLANWSVWKDRGFPAGAPAAGSDDMEMVAALVWREPATQVLRVNMFGTRAGKLIEWHWNGGMWTWGALVNMPVAGMRVTDGAVLSRSGIMPRLSIFAVTPAGVPFEFVFNETVGSWSWQLLN